MSWGERGQAVAELALLLPLFVFGLLGAADFTRAFSMQLAVQNAARAGAEAAAIGIAATDDQIRAQAREELSRVPGLDPLAATFDVTRTTGADGARLVTVRARYTFETLVAWPLIPVRADFDRSSTMRRFP